MLTKSRRRGEPVTAAARRIADLMTLAAGFETLADVAKLRALQVIEHRDTAERAGVPGPVGAGR